MILMNTKPFSALLTNVMMLRMYYTQMKAKHAKMLQLYGLPQRVHF